VGRFEIQAAGIGREEDRKGEKLAGAIIPTMTNQPIVFRIHAVQRMFERRISMEAVRQVLQSGEMIEDYSEEMPDPGGLLSAKRGQRPLHVVKAEDTKEGELVVITVYEPDPAQWKAGFRSRKE
jgi:hypothetical protein